MDVLDNGSMLALADMLKGAADIQDMSDPAPKGLVRASSSSSSSEPNPGSIGPSSSSSRKTKPVRPAMTTTSSDIWDEADVDVEIDTRPTPEYTITFSQSVSADDMYLPSRTSSASTASVHDADGVVVRIVLPGTRRTEVDLEVTGLEMDVRCPSYRLRARLPRAVDETRGRATWEKGGDALIVRLPFAREE
ncbi:Protein pih1d3 [Thoreauomyces humboldtii]|nr:Protein pih1d3 [Thoreauomyces humboldtii]